VPTQERLTEVEHQREQLEQQVGALNDHIRSLLRQLDDAAEERAELRRLLAGAMQALPAPREQPEVPPVVPAPATESPYPTPEKPASRRRARSWLDRLLGR
jgi:septal ring factor EnvC (AmiA/AmiB activator)